jgi:alpha-tubulin suppressor-like RCC1 family protein
MNDTAKSRIYDKKVNSPLLVQGLAGVVELACGENFDVARCADGTCYTWGISECGEFGRPIPELKFPAGEDGRQPFDFDTIEQECMTPKRVMIRATDSSNASNWSGADRMKDSDGEDLVPVDNVQAVGCGVYHMFVVVGPTSKSTVYACGLNNYGQLGLGELKDEDRMVSTLKHVQTFDSKQIVKLDGYYFFFMHLSHSASFPSKPP